MAPAAIDRFAAGAYGSRMARTTSGPSLWVESGGSGGPALLLLHGRGANAAVWEGLRPLLAARWPGRWVAPDLRGHGRSEHRAPYAFATHAADVAGLFEPGEEVVVLGHSMGGAVAMSLASRWFGVRVRQVIAFGVKLVWSEEEIAKAQELARAPVRWFATREEAVERYLRAPASRDWSIRHGHGRHRRGGGRFRLAADPGITAVVGPPIEGVIAAMRAPLRLAAGERDPMVSPEQMRRFDPQAAVLPGLGHNPHVEAPERLWRHVEKMPASDPKRIALEAAEAGAAAANRVAVALDPGEALDEAADGHTPSMRASDMPGAGMDAGGEGEVPVGLRRKVEPLGIGEVLGIAIGRADAESDELPPAASRRRTRSPASRGGCRAGSSFRAAGTPRSPARSARARDQPLAPREGAAADRAPLPIRLVVVSWPAFSRKMQLCSSSSFAEPLLAPSSG